MHKVENDRSIQSQSQNESGIGSGSSVTSSQLNSSSAGASALDDACLSFGNWEPYLNEVCDPSFFPPPDAPDLFRLESTGLNIPEEPPMLTTTYMGNLSDIKGNQMGFMW